jgi:hypothetical protein
LRTVACSVRAAVRWRTAPTIASAPDCPVHTCVMQELGSASKCRGVESRRPHCTGGTRGVHRK